MSVIMERPFGVVSWSGLLLLFLSFTCLGSCEVNGEPSEGLPGHMQPLGSHQPMEGEIERLSHIPDPVTFYQEYVDKNRPVVLEGAVRDIPPLTKWTDEYLKYVSSCNSKSKFPRSSAPSLYLTSILLRVCYMNLSHFCGD